MILSPALLVGLAIQDQTTLKESLPNGASVFVHRLSGTDGFSVALTFTSRQRPEEPGTHGLRHLLEHFASKGPKADVDAGLEKEGMVLLAETTRDSIVFQVSGKAGQLASTLTSLCKVLDPVSPGSDDLRKECAVISQELALRPWTTQLQADAWRKAYSEKELDPFGDVSALEKVTPEGLKDAQTSMFRPDSACVAVVGAIDVDDAAKRARELLSKLVGPRSNDEVWVRDEGVGPVRVGAAEGSLTALPVGPFAERTMLSALAACLGVEAWIPGARTFYTVTPRAGLVAVALPAGRSWANEKANLMLGSSSVARAGLRALKAWSDGVLSNPRSLAKTFALCLSLRPGLSIEALKDAVDRVPPREVQAQLARLLEDPK